MRTYLQSSILFYLFHLDPDIIPECKEGAGTTVLRYLKAVVAWDAALNDLTATPFMKQAVTNFIVGRWYLHVS
jgi:hypothetical protein